MSVVTALSLWLVHTNRRMNGSWTRRYNLGVPDAEPTPIPEDGTTGTTGTTVHFLPDPALTTPAGAGPEAQTHYSAFPNIDVLLRADPPP